jgi:hypothetical protein
LVLVVSPARELARGEAYRPVRYELRGISARDEYGGADLVVMHGARPRSRWQDADHERDGDQHRANEMAHGEHP